jgi:hypothetical protein
MRSRFLLSGLRRRRRATSRIVHVEIQSPLYFDPDSYHCPMSLSSELRLVKTLLKIAKECLSPKLKTHATELHARKHKLQAELKIRAAEEAVPL